MKKFKFGLQKVLQLRELKEDQRAQELAALKEELIRTEKLLENIRRENARMIAHVEHTHLTPGQKLDIRQLHDCCDYLENLKIKLARQTEEIRNLVVKIEHKRVELIEASKEKKIMEKLKERQYQNFLREVEMWERKVLDEIGTIEFNRKKLIYEYRANQ